VQSWRDRTQRQRVIAEHKHCIAQEVKRWEVKHQVLASEVGPMEECQREHRRSFWTRGEKKQGLHGYSGNNTNFFKEGTKPDVLHKVYFATRAAEDGRRRRPVLDLSPMVQRYIA
jgi:hypothetical protein